MPRAAGAALLWWMLVAVTMCVVPSAEHAAAAPQRTVLNAWTPASPSRVGPPPRVGAVMAAPSPRAVLLYGGMTEGPGITDTDYVPLGDVWMYDLNDDNWVQLPSPEDLQPRGYHAATELSEVDGVAFIFGGQVSPGEPASRENLLTDSLVRVETRGNKGVRLLGVPKKEDQPWPPARALHSFNLVNAPAPLKRCGVLFGGVSPTAEPLGDTWLLNPTTHRWTKIEGGASPAARMGQVTASFTQGLILTSGCTGLQRDCADNALKDVWQFIVTSSDCTAGHWLLVEKLNIRIPPRFGGVNSLVFGTDIVVFGGPDPTMDPRTYYTVSITFSETGNATSAEWRINTVTPASSAPPRRKGFVVMATQRRTSSFAVLFGGAAPLSLLGDTWRLGAEGPFWTRSESDIVQPVHAILPAYATLGRSAYLFGGQTVSGQRNNGMWRYDLEDNTWQLLHTASGATAGASCMVALTSSHLAIYGGARNIWEYERASQELRIFDTRTNSMDQVVPGDLPYARAGHVCAAHENQMIVHGGWQRLNRLQFKSATYRDDLWIGTWTDTPLDIVWERVTPDGTAPSPRGGHIGAVVNTFDNRTVFMVYGGAGRDGLDTDAVYGLDLHAQSYTWERHSLLGNGRPRPTALFSGKSVLLDHVVVVHGGLERVNDTWTMSNEVYTLQVSDIGWSWRHIRTLAPPDNSRFAHAAFVMDSPATLTIVGGAELTAQQLRSRSSQHATRLGCNAGEFSPAFGEHVCRPCQFGTYNDDSGSTRCTQCPGISTTSAEGAAAEDDCNVCQEGTCVNGICVLDLATHEFDCVCSAGWGGARCDVHVAAIVAGSIVAVVVLALVVFVVTRRVRRGFFRMKELHHLQERLIEESRVELCELKRVWEVLPTDLTFTKRIDGSSEGAYGEVWLALWQDREVAVKKLKSSILTFDDHALDDFDAEISLIRSLRHRNIVLFYGAGVLEEGPFLVTEYMARGSLSTILRSDVPLSYKHLLGFARDMVNGVMFLHELQPPRMHRDIKSANLLVSENWVVKVADFGTARLCGQTMEAEVLPDFASQQMTTGVGTLLWTAPEILSRQPYGPPADVYSVGIVLYEIATRRVPYEELAVESHWTLRDTIVQGTRPRLGLPEAGSLVSRNGRPLSSSAVAAISQPHSSAREGSGGVHSLVNLEVGLHDTHEQSAESSAGTDDEERGGDGQADTAVGETDVANAASGEEDGSGGGADEGAGAGAGEGVRGLELADREHTPLAYSITFVRLVRKCWRAKPEARPTMRHARAVLDTL